MCFSPAASFIAGGALGAAGLYTLKHAKTRDEVPFAAIPFFFAVQQVIEGFGWLSFGHPEFHAFFTYAFVAFSHVLWPIFLPYAVWSIEPDVRRRKWLTCFVWLGLMVSLTLLISILHGPVTSEVVGHCIVYGIPSPNVPYGLWIYVLATCGTCLISSQKYIRVLGLAMLGALAIAYWEYQKAFYSVWCFFAAILSLIVYVHLRYRGGDEQLRSKKRK